MDICWIRNFLFFAILTDKIIVKLNYQVLLIPNGMRKKNRRFSLLRGKIPGIFSLSLFLKEFTQIVLNKNLRVSSKTHKPNLCQEVLNSSE